MMNAYHIIGMDNADLFRLRDGRISESKIVEKARTLYGRILQSGKLVARGVATSNPAETQVRSRQFALDHLVGDDQYVYLSLGKRYWNEPSSVNFGFIFDAESLLRDGAILRKRDLLGDYGDLLDEVVQEFVPAREPEEFSPDEVKRIMEALEDPDATDYVSPNDAYYTLLDAVEHQNLDIPQAREATAEFIKRARALQEQQQLTGEAAIQAAQQEGETGQFEILVKCELAISYGCIGMIREGAVEMLQVVHRQLTAMYGPSAPYSEHKVGDVVRYAVGNVKKQGEILHVCPPGQQVVEGGAIHGMEYIVDGGTGFPDVVRPGDIIVE